MARAKRKDKSKVVLRVGEVQRANGSYHFCWTDSNGKRHYIYAKTLVELREKEVQIQKDKADGIKVEAKSVTINYIRANPANNVLRELKKSHCYKTEKRRGLTKPEQELLLDFLRRNKTYSHWYPIFAVMIGSGLRVGEVTGLRWCDIDLEEGIIDVNHNLVHYAHRSEGYQTGCYFNVTSPKTKASIRQVPMLDFVKEAFLLEKEYQEKLGIKCNVVIDGYTDFIFVNRFGMAQNGSMLNKAIQPRL